MKPRRLGAVDQRVVRLLSQGWSPKEIAGKLGLTINAVYDRVQRLSARLKTRGAAGLVGAAYRDGSIDAESTQPTNVADQAEAADYPPRDPWVTRAEAAIGHNLPRLPEFSGDRRKLFSDDRRTGVRNRRRGERPKYKAPYTKLTDELTKRIWAAHAAGLSHREIAERVGVSRSTVARVLRRDPP